MSSSLSSLFTYRDGHSASYVAFPGAATYSTLHEAQVACATDAFCTMVYTTNQCGMNSFRVTAATSNSSSRQHCGPSTGAPTTNMTVTAARTTNQNSAWNAANPACQIDADGCVTDGPGNYRDHERCTINVTTGGAVTATQYTTYSADYLTIAGTQYRYSAPTNIRVHAGDTISWYSSTWSNRAGFKLCPVSLPETKLNAVWEKTASDVSTWQDATCVGCMVSSAANYDPTASYDAGCWPSLTSTISCGQTVTGEVTNAALPSAYRYYEFTMAPGDRFVFSTCGLPRSNDNMLTMLFITTQNGTRVSSFKTSHVTSGFGPARGGECGPVMSSYGNTAAEISVGEGDTADLCTDPDPVTGLCTFNVVLRPWSTSAAWYNTGFYNLRMVCASCADHTANNYHNTSRFDAVPNSTCVYANNTDCVGAWADCDTACADVAYTVTTPYFGYGARCLTSTKMAFGATQAGPSGDTRACQPGDGACPNVPNCSLSTFGDHHGWDFRMMDGTGDGWAGAEATIYGCDGTQLLPSPGVDALTMVGGTWNPATTVMAVTAARTTNKNSAWNAANPACQIDSSGCVTDGPGNYRDHERCTITVTTAGAVTATQYTVQTYYGYKYDYLTIAGTQYRYSAPTNVAVSVGDTISWYSGNSGNGAGFTLCPRARTLPSVSNFTEPTC
jgi:plastocyanin